VIEIVLVHPEIPPNAGNVIRLAANTGARLHLVQPLGFAMDDRQLRRAGLDYHDMANVTLHEGWEACAKTMQGRRLFACTTRGPVNAYDVRFDAGDVFVFGAETRGLPQAILEGFAPQRRIRLPMRPGNRSLNLSNAVAVTVFEAWRQLGFPGCA
jgi:tRNA (cytidine/uridine-2'-O-)-methyltransferase